MSGLPSAVRGIRGVGYADHCATSGGASVTVRRNTAAAAMVALKTVTAANYNDPTDCRNCGAPLAGSAQFLLRSTPARIRSGWIVDPDSRSLEINLLEGERYGSSRIVRSGPYASVTQQGLAVDVEPLFVWFG